MRINSSCPNCGHIEGQGDECELEVTNKGKFYCNCPDCGVESGVNETAQNAVNEFFQKPRMITVTIQVEST